MDTGNRVSITEGELLDALRAALEKPAANTEDGHTAGELADLLSWPPKKVTAVLKRLWKAGEIECVRAPRLTMDGRMAPTPVYRVKRGPKLAA